MKTPQVSILTTIYNREKYISDCIESVLASSFQDWEMILVDDQSTDHSVEIAKAYETKDPRIKVYVNKTNLGDYPNRNKAASYAKGKYIKYLDADDMIYPHGLQIMVNAMEQYPETVLGSQCVIREYKTPYPCIINSKTLFESYFSNHNFFSSGPTGTIIKKEIFDKVGGYSGKRFIGDTELWIKMALEGPVVFFQPALIWWRTHEDQETNHEKKNINELLDNKHNLFKSIISDKRIPLNLNQRKKIITNYKLQNIKQGISSIIKYGDPKTGLLKIKNALDTFEL